MVPFRIFILAIALLMPFAMFQDLAQAQATTYTVNSTNNVDGGTCDATHCSLREAINAANANVGTDTIAFNISGAGPHTIQLALGLPKITDPVIIDGYTQPGASPNTNGVGLGSNAVLKIELDGTNAGDTATGLNLLAGNCMVRGLVINRFLNGGIVVDENGGNVIEGNFIGTDATGTAPAANSNGVAISTDNNTVGGTLAGARNVISGNNFDGVVISQGATGNVVHGNLIGTDASGTADLGNRIGVRVDGTGNTVGGTVAGARNVISGNDTSGVEIGTGNVVQGNFIGTDAAGTNPLGNAVHGVFVPSITFGNAILRNTIFSNAGGGIDLGAPGVTLNDAADGDTGANNLQNFPDISKSEIDNSGNVTVQYSVDSAASNSAYPLRIEFFEADSTASGEGKAFLGSDDYPANSAQNGKSTDLGNAAGLGIASGDVLVATATDANNNTSEFSATASVSVAPIPTPTPIPTVSQWGLIILAGLMIAVLLWRMRRSRSIGTA